MNTHSSLIVLVGLITPLLAKNENFVRRSTPFLAFLAISLLFYDMATEIVQHLPHKEYEGLFLFPLGLILFPLLKKAKTLRKKIDNKAIRSFFFLLALGLHLIFDGVMMESHHNFIIPILLHRIPLYFFIWRTLLERFDKIQAYTLLLGLVIFTAIIPLFTGDLLQIPLASFLLGLLRPFFSGILIYYLLALIRFKTIKNC